MLDVTGLRKSYGGLTAVDSVNFDVETGEIVGLMGPNGAGKTTLFDVITGVTPADGGRVTVDGKELTGVRPNRLCQAGVARTFQTVRTFPGATVLENVLTGATFGAGDDRKRARERALSCLEFVGLAELAGRAADGLPIAARKRVELARALATAPSYLLLDEIGSGLTPEEVSSLTAIIERVRDDRGIGVFWIEHVTDALLSSANRVLVLHDGEFIANGTPAEIRENTRVAEAYLGTDTNSDHDTDTDSTRYEATSES